MLDRSIFGNILSTTLVALLLLVGCSAPAPSSSAYEPAPGEISIIESWARPSPQAEGNGAAYAVILNGLERPVRLTGVSSPVAKTAELHETLIGNDVMRMVQHPEGFEIASGEALFLEPGGKHVMLIDLEKPLAPGDIIEVQFLFGGMDPIVIDMPVSEPN